MGIFDNAGLAYFLYHENLLDIEMPDSTRIDRLARLLKVKRDKV